MGAGLVGIVERTWIGGLQKGMAIYLDHFPAVCIGVGEHVGLGLVSP